MVTTAIREKFSARRRANLKAKENSISQFIAEMRSMAEISGTHFTKYVRSAVEKSGGKYLFEFPAVLLSEGKSSKSSTGNAAAVLDMSKENYHLVFIEHLPNSETLHITEENDAPEKLVEFAWSYAKVLTLLPQTYTKAMQ